MSRAARWMVRILGVAATLVVLLVLWAALLPASHSASTTELYAATPAELWAMLTDAEEFPRWRTDVERVEVSERQDDGSPLAWTEHSSFGPLPLRIVKRSAPYLLITRIDSDELGFGGTWSYRIEEMGEGRVRLTITEDGQVSNLFFRWMSHYVFGHEGTMRSYHAHLARALGS